MDMGELAAFELSLAKEYKAKCPFADDEPGGSEAGDEDIKDDDLDGVQAAQKNDGGKLGENLESALAGAAEGGPFPSKDFLVREKANDSYRGRQSKVEITQFKDASGGAFPFTVAAHHLLPGNASGLTKESKKKTLTKIFQYMAKDQEFESLAKKKYKIKHHIGYDVNGAHNGVWLPGNYAIKTAKPKRKTKSGRTLAARPGTTPVSGKSWRGLGSEHEQWQYDYVAATCKAAGGQFHDSHERPYSANVRKWLAKINVALQVHQDYCEDCQKKTEVPPPYRIKRRLYAMSRCLRGYVTGPPVAWKHPWFTSEKWSGKYFQNGKVTQDFLDAYSESVETNPNTPRLPS